ncbi:MAG TPA: sodium-independent anion transporter [Candidatus Omnitrophota bacterium]|nr:sodium-independent anion transporter [Candidatus Omnitrophota bacterium]
MNQSIKFSADIDVYEVQDVFLFEALLKYDEVMRGIGRRPKVRVVVLEKISQIDPTGLRCLKDFAQRCKKQKIHLVLSGVNLLVLSAIKDFGICELVNQSCIFDNREGAIQKAEELKLSTVNY